MKKTNPQRPLCSRPAAVRRASSGFALLEALIAILLFSVGILGMVALQAKATQFSVNSQDRTTAAVLANDMVAELLATNSVTPSAASLAAWKARILKELPPSGDGVLSMDSCGNSEVSVVWQSLNKNDSSSAASGSSASAASSSASSVASSAASSGGGITAGYTACVSGFIPPAGINSVFTTKFILMPAAVPAA